MSAERDEYEGIRAIRLIICSDKRCCPPIFSRHPAVCTRRSSKYMLRDARDRDAASSLSPAKCDTNKSSHQPLFRITRRNAEGTFHRVRRQYKTQRVRDKPQRASLPNASITSARRPPAAKSRKRCTTRNTAATRDVRFMSHNACM